MKRWARLNMVNIPVHHVVPVILSALRNVEKSFTIKTAVAAAVMNNIQRIACLIKYNQIFIKVSAEKGCKLCLKLVNFQT
jgi:hypothetical protein